MLRKEISASSNKKGPFVYGFIDLFSGPGESWSWGFGMDEKSGKKSSVEPRRLEDSTLGYDFREKEPDKDERPFKMQHINQSLLPSPTAKLHTLDEETEDSNQSISSTDSNRSLEEELVRNVTDDEEDVSNVIPNRVFFFFFEDWMCDFVELAYLDA